MEIVDLVLLRDQHAPLVAETAESPLVELAHARVLLDHQSAQRSRPLRHSRVAALECFLGENNHSTTSRVCSGDTGRMRAVRT